MIIIEGPDGSGKSTLIKNILQQLDGFKVVAWNDPPKNAEQLAKNLHRSKDLVRSGQLVIQDRTPWITEPIYDVAKNGPDKLPTWRYYQAGLTLLRSTLIYCRPPDDVIKKHAVTGSSPPDTPAYLKWIEGNIDDLVNLYDAFMEPIRPMIYDWTKPDEKLIPELLKIVKREEMLALIKANSKNAKARGTKKEVPRPLSIPKSGPDD